MKRREFLMLTTATALLPILRPRAARAQYSTTARYQAAYDKLRRGYAKIHNPSERARAAYIGNLADLRKKAVDANIADVWKEIDTEVKAHPAPANSDGKALAALLVGQWQSPRGEYLDRADGTWTMLPDKEGTTHGTWRIEGNQFYDTTSLDPSKTTQYTIILITKRDFIFTDKETVFYETRTK